MKPSDTELLSKLAIRFILSHECNIQCGHCGDAGPVHPRPDRIDLGIILRTLAECQELGIKKYNITGGEPMLFLDDVFRIMRAGMKHGLEGSIHTNAFWGSDVKYVTRTLKEFKEIGVKRIVIGYDRFHAEFIDFSCVKAVAETGRGMGISVDVRMAVTDLGVEDITILRLLKKNNINFKITPCIPAGRAKKLPTTYFHTTDNPLKTYLSTKCGDMLAPIVDTDGKLYPCCNLLPPSDTIYALGDLSRDSLQTIMAHVLQDPLYRTMLIHQHPAYLYTRFPEQLRKLGLQTRTKDKYFCDICYSLLGNKRYLALFRTSLSS